MTSNQASQDLAVNNTINLPALTTNMAAVYAEEMDGLTFSYDKVKIPSGGGLTFEIGEDDDLEVAKEIIGIIVDQHPVNAYWANSYGGGNAAPDCSSMDGKLGTNFGPCDRCPNNQWGSDMATGGKLCKNQRRIYILQEGAMLPVLLTLPPTSIKSFSNYISNRLINKGKRPRYVLTKFALKKVANSAGINYSEVTFSKVGELPSEMWPSIDEYCEQLKATTRSLSYSDDYTEDDDSPF